MTPTDLDSLRQWATAHAPHGSVQARQVLALLAHVAELEAGRLKADAELIGRFEAAIYGTGGIWPSWVYEAREAIRHQNEKIPWLPDLLAILGWQGGTVHEAMNAVARLVVESKQRATKEQS